VALARTLNRYVLQIVQILDKYKTSTLFRLLSIPLAFTQGGLNEIYVYVTKTLEELYEADRESTTNIFPGLWENTKILCKDKQCLIDCHDFLEKHNAYCNEIERQWILLGKPDGHFFYQTYFWLDNVQQRLDLYQKELLALRRKEKRLHVDWDEALFILSYDEMKGELLVNKRLVRKIRTDSTLDKLLVEANRRPGERISICGHSVNISKAINNLRLPKPMKDLFFRNREQKSCIVCPIITRRMLLEDEVDFDEIEVWLEDYPL
jgi:hypothetical protein